MLQEKVREYEERTSALEREVQERRACESDIHTVVQAMGRMKKIIEKGHVFWQRTSNTTWG